MERSRNAGPPRDRNAFRWVYSVSPWGNLTGATNCALDHLLFLGPEIAAGCLILAHRGPLEARARAMGVNTKCFAFENRGLRQASLWRKATGFLPVLRSRWRYVRNLKNLLRAQPGILHVHSRMGASRYALLGGRWAGVPIVLTLHEFPDKRKWAAWRDAWLIRRLANRVVAVSEATAQAYRPQFKNLPIDVIRNALRIPQERASRSSEKVVFAMIGLLGPRKGTEEFLQACARLRPAAVGFEAWLVGDWISTEERDKAVARAAELGLPGCVVFRGAVADMAAIYRNIDFVVVPSHAETFSLVAMEGMGFGLPVVASAVGGLPELIVEGQTGFLVPAGDVQALADRIRGLVQDASLRQNMGEAGRELAMRLFAPESYARAMLDVYRALKGAGGFNRG